MPTVLVIHHSPTDTVREISGAVVAAAREAAVAVNQSAAKSSPLEIQELTALDAAVQSATSPSELVEQLLAADAVIFGTTANFGYISGALKHYFDTTFIDSHEDTKGLPVSWWIRGGHDTTGAAKAMRSITTGYGMELAAEPVEFTGEVVPHLPEVRAMAEDVVGVAAQRAGLL